MTLRFDNEDKRLACGSTNIFEIDYNKTFLGTNEGNVKIYSTKDG